MPGHAAECGHHLHAQQPRDTQVPHWRMGAALQRLQAHHHCLQTQEWVQIKRSGQRWLFVVPEFIGSLCLFNYTYDVSKYEGKTSLSIKCITYMSRLICLFRCFLKAYSFNIINSEVELTWPFERLVFYSDHSNRADDHFTCPVQRTGAVPAADYFSCAENRSCTAVDFTCHVQRTGAVRSLT